VGRLKTFEVRRRRVPYDGRDYLAKLGLGLRKWIIDEIRLGMSPACARDERQEHWQQQDQPTVSVHHVVSPFMVVGLSSTPAISVQTSRNKGYRSASCGEEVVARPATAAKIARSLPAGCACSFCL
jgi:hypothetical protein